MLYCMVTKKILGQRLQHARKMLNLTQDGVAKLCPGVEKTRLSNYEQGIREPDIETLSRLSQALKVPVSELLADHDLSKDDIHLLQLFRSIDTDKRTIILTIAESFRSSLPAA